MKINKINDHVAVSPQIRPEDIPAIAAAGYRSIVCHRPDGESPDQPSFAEVETAAKAAGLEIVYQPIEVGIISDEQAEAFAQLLNTLPGPVFAYCRSGARSATLWSLSQAERAPLPTILAQTDAAGYNMNGVARRIANGGKTPTNEVDASHSIVIVGAGAAGVSVAASLLARDSTLDIAIIDPADVHYYQPGWTMVGAGVFDADVTARTMASLIPKRVHWLKHAVVAFEPTKNAVVLDGCRVVRYQRLIVCPGLKLDWAATPGLTETLGKNGVTSNYRYDLAPYTWKLTQELKRGRALFTQPPMPIKCAGAPQKAMYLSADHWRRQRVLRDVQIEFHNAGGVLFGVKDYVPALMKYVERYNVQLKFHSNLISIDGPAKTARFRIAKPDAPVEEIEVGFDMIHVTPPQCAPDFIRVSPLADADGWVDVDQATLRHKTFDNIWALGDVMNAPNAKTAAAARKQAPTVAENVIADIHYGSPVAQYDGYGSCPLTVERGKIVLAEFGYGGALLPSFPSWVINGKKPSRLAWWLKERFLPPLYWLAMLRGREWLAKPEKLNAPAPKAK